MRTEPYGTWKSPITAQMAAAGSLDFSEIKLHKGTLYWLEKRSSENGRTALVSWNDRDGEKELLPKEYNIRTRVHEYGGGALLVFQDQIYFVHDGDQQIYRLLPGQKVQKVTAQSQARFADGCANPLDGSLYYVMEEHGDTVVNSIVKIDPKTGQTQKIASGHDFYSNPRISPDGKSLAFLSWNHPNMPWNETQLYVLDLKSNQLRQIDGEPNESIADPHWSNEGKLYYVSDRNNWWNIYREGKVKPLWTIDGEFALPQWVFGRSLFSLSNQGIVGTYVKSGSHRFGTGQFEGAWQDLDLPFTNVKDTALENQTMAMIAGSPEQPNAIISLDLKTKTWKTVKSSRIEPIDSHYFSHPAAIEFPTADGRIAHAFYYPPCNPHFSGMPGELPPLIVHSHGGPTAHSSPIFSTGILYWTSRGFAIVDVNYGGSTGYGRAYRDLLKDSWGIVDVDDCTFAALHCADLGLADRNRLAIEGGSAGGFTTLAALAFHNVFKIGADYFGVSDLERLTLDTHKFESRYLEQLVGPYPEKREVYIKRSPIHRIDQIKCPIIIFQGDEDAVVPPSQSELMYKSLIERKIPTAYLLYKGEQHGFRKAENIQRSLEAQLYFFSKVLGLKLNEKIDPVFIVNLVDETDVVH